MFTLQQVGEFLYENIKAPAHLSIQYLCILYLCCSKMLMVSANRSVSNVTHADIYKVYCTPVLALIKLHEFQKSLDKPLGTVSMCDDNIFELVRTRTYFKFNHWAVISFRLLKHYSKLSWTSFIVNCYHKPWAYITTHDWRLIASWPLN